MLCCHCGQACLKLALMSANPTRETKAKLSLIPHFWKPTWESLTPFGFNITTCRFSFTSSGIKTAQLSGAILYLRCAQPSPRMSRNFLHDPPYLGTSRTFTFHDLLAGSSEFRFLAFECFRVHWCCRSY